MSQPIFSDPYYFDPYYMRDFDYNGLCLVDATMPISYDSDPLDGCDPLLFLPDQTPCDFSHMDDFGHEGYDHLHYISSNLHDMVTTIFPPSDEIDEVDCFSSIYQPKDKEACISRTPWTKEDDEKLIRAVNELKKEGQNFSWKAVKRLSRLSKDPKQLREHYVDQLDQTYYQGTLEKTEEIGLFLIVQATPKNKKGQHQWKIIQDLFLKATKRELLLSPNKLKNTYNCIKNRIIILSNGQITIKPRRRRKP